MLILIGGLLVLTLVVWLATGPQRRYYNAVRPRRRIFDWERNKQGFILGVLAIAFSALALGCMALSLLAH